MLKDSTVSDHPRPQLPRLEAITMKALARRPEDRYESAHDLGQALRIDDRRPPVDGGEDHVEAGRPHRAVGLVELVEEEAGAALLPVGEGLPVGRGHHEEHRAGRVPARAHGARRVGRAARRGRRGAAGAAGEGDEEGEANAGSHGPGSWGGAPAPRLNERAKRRRFSAGSTRRTGAERPRPGAGSRGSGGRCRRSRRHGRRP